MNLQTQYDLDTAQIAERDNQRETIAVTPSPLPKERDPPKPLPIGDLCHDSAMPK